MQIKALSATGTTIQIRLNTAEGHLLSEVTIPGDTEWEIVKNPLEKFESGIYNLVVVLKDENPVEIDWINFK